MRRHELVLMCLLGAIQFLDACDIFLLGKMTPMVAAGFGLSPRAVAPVFIVQQVGLACGALIGGRLLDRVNRGHVLIVSGVMSGFTTCAVSWAPDFTLLCAARFLSGGFMGAAGAAVLTLGATLGGARASWVLTAILACNSLGISAGSLYVAFFAADHGWRLGFWLVGAALVVISGIAAVRLRAGEYSALVARPAPPVALTGQRAGGRSGIIRLALCQGLTGGLIAALAAWSAAYFLARSGVSIQRFASVGLLYAPAAVIGMVGCGWLADRTSFPMLARAVFLTHAIALFCVGAMSFGSGLFAVAYFVSIVGQTAGQAVLGLTVRANHASAERGRVFGIVAASGRVGGIVSPWLGSVALESGLSLGAFYACAAAVPLAALLLLPRRMSNR
jgi:AAHS family 4-hydroxybenzoate transporter-like MFS transporter